MQLQIFKYQEKDHFDNLTTLEIDGEAWFVASEVCKVLDIKNSRDAVSRLEEDEKGVSALPTSSGIQEKLIVSESGLYALIFRSKKPEAKKFRQWITKEVIPAIRKTGVYGARNLTTPNFVVRFNENWQRVEKGRFSVLSELFIRLYGQFEQLGYQIPDKSFDGKEIRPDVSVGRLFSSYLQEHHPESAEKYTTYLHQFPSGYEVEARQYDNKLLHLFIKFVDEVWIPEKAARYFETRDKVALDYLPKLLEQNN